MRNNIGEHPRRRFAYVLCVCHVPSDNYMPTVAFRNQSLVCLHLILILAHLFYVVFRQRQLRTEPRFTADLGK